MRADFLAAFFLVDFLALLLVAFFLVDFLAAFFLVDFLALLLAAFFLVDFLVAAFFLVDRLAVFFAAAFFFLAMFLAPVVLGTPHGLKRSPRAPNWESTVRNELKDQATDKAPYHLGHLSSPSTARIESTSVHFRQYESLANPNNFSEHLLLPDHRKTNFVFESESPKESPRVSGSFVEDASSRCKRSW